MDQAVRLLLSSGNVQVSVAGSCEPCSHFEPGFCL